MPPLTDLAQLGAGGVLLYLGAEWLVKGAAGLARRFGVSALVIGLTVVAYATSAPELAVSVRAALDGKSAITLGNVVGSNIANLGFILGCTALISPPRVSGGLIRLEVPVLVLTTLLVPVLLVDGRIGRVEGFALTAGALTFTWVLLRSGRRGEPAERDAEPTAERDAEAAGAPAGESKLRLALIGLAGLAGLVLGGDVFVRGAVGLAAHVGMSERVVGLTIVALGTSLPELAASLVAALRGHSELAVGNVIGSNVFNVLLILGISSLVSPIQAPLEAIQTDAVALSVLTLLAAIALRTERKLTRLEGILLVGGYAAFLVTLVLGVG